MTNDWASALLKPSRVALVGVSNDPSKTSGRPLQFLRRSGFSGDIQIVNPRRKMVQGEPAWPSLTDLPERPDHVFILTDAEIALEAFSECQSLGVPVATILSSGFLEAGDSGRENQVHLEAILERGGTRLIGPSSIGVVNVHTGLTLTANAAFAEGELPTGNIFVASHSGSLIGALVSRGKRKGIGFAGLVSVGGESDLSIGEICSATLDDPEVESYVLFLETLRHAESLRTFACEAAKRGKPVVAFKLGRSKEAAELAVSHTGSLAGADEVAETFLAECGIARVETFEGLIEASSLLKQIPPTTEKRRGKVGVITTTGGGAAMAVEQMALRGVDVVAPSKETRTKLRLNGIEPGEGRIIDLTLAGTQYDVMKGALDILRESPEFDLVLVSIGSSARFNPELAVQPAIDAAIGHGNPLAVYLVPDAPDAMRLLAQSNVPAFQSPETCGDVVAAALHRRAFARASSLELDAQGSEQFRTLDEADSYGLLKGVGVTSAPHMVLGTTPPIPDFPFLFPVAAKVLDVAIPHKTEAGGVVLNIGSRDELAEAIEMIRSHVAERMNGHEVQRILVQQMTKGLGEVLLGFKRDPQVGPIVVLAAGGIYTELFRDTTMRLAPVDKAVAMEMIHELAVVKVFEGFRGGPKGDIDALADAIVGMSKLAHISNVKVEEAEVNPLLILPDGEGVLAVDALMRVLET